MLDWLKSLPWYFLCLVVIGSVPFALFALGLLIIFFDSSSVSSEDKWINSRFGCIMYPLYLGFCAALIFAAFLGPMALCAYGFGWSYEISFLVGLIAGVALIVGYVARTGKDRL